MTEIILLGTFHYSERYGENGQYTGKLVEKANNIQNLYAIHNETRVKTW